MKCLRINEVSKKLGVARSTIYKMVADGDLPQPIKMGRASLWIEDDLNQFLLKLKAERDQQNQDPGVI